MWSSSLSQQSSQPLASGWSCLARCNDGSASFNLPNQHQGSSQQSRHELEELLMSEFNKLSLNEQAKALDDLYSAAGAELKENPAIIDSLLQDFEHQVERVRYPIYEVALKQDRSYVEDPAFRLKFLRANMYDVQIAVKQMINFLFQKVKYFGAEKVARDITIDDLTTNDLKLMLSGLYHIQDGTDRNGRLIFYILSKHPPDVDSEIRVLYYIWFNILLPINSVQMKGIVSIHHLMKADGDEQSSAGLSGLMRYAEFATSVPIRSSAFHLCLRREGGTVANCLVTLSRFILKVVPKHMRDRSRVHLGSPIELKYQLSTYGIPQDTFPIDVGGNLRDSIRNAWFYNHLDAHGGIAPSLMLDDDESLSADEESSEQLSSSISAREENAAEDEGVVLHSYTDRDVLLGKGYPVQNHPGNTAFREFLRDYQHEYDDSPRYTKQQIVRNLTRSLMASGVRFWQKIDGDVWVETSVDEAEKKVGQAFRSARKKK